MNCESEAVPVTQMEAPMPEIIYQQIDYTDSIDFETHEESVEDYMPDTFSVLCAIMNEIPGVEITASNHVYPNPASGQLNIDVPAKATSIYILNGLGQQVFLSESANHMHVDCTSWVKGIYWLFITGNDGILFKEPFILN